jgi:hypothetical protein
MQVDGCISMSSENRLGMVIPIFVVTAVLAVIFLACVEVALLRDCRVPQVIYAVRFRDVLLDSEMDNQEEEPWRTLSLSA